MNFHDLPAATAAWLQSLGEVRRLDRAVARREAWLVDIARPDGSLWEGFFRLEREPVAGNPWSLAKETGIVRALGATSVPVPRVLAEDGRLHCTLFERMPGRADLPAQPPARQRAVMEHFIDILADWHRLDPAALDLPAMLRPASDREAALSEMDLIVDRYRDFLAHHRDPLITYGLQWLERFAPTRVERISLLQGDTGPVNFMFDDDRVSAVIDWEWGHLGDPMEDLGNICVRNFWNPSGPLTELFQRYEARSGIPVDWSSVRYYRVQQNMRGMVPIAADSLKASLREPLAWAMAYRYVGDRSTVEAMADRMGLELLRPELPEAGEDGIVARAACFSLEHDVAPAVENAFARSRANDAAILVRCLDRLRRFEAWVDRAELDDMGALLGRRPASLADGLATVDAAVREQRLDEEMLVLYLGRRAYRAEWLYAPVTALYPDRQWTPLARN